MAQTYEGTGIQEGFEVAKLFEVIEKETQRVQQKIEMMKSDTSRESISIANMFEMQMLMNHLSQLCEMSTQITSASHTAIMSMARSLKQ